MVKKKFLMCPPTYFDIAYEINAWMSQDNQVDQVKAGQQWQNVQNIYRSLGHEIMIIEPVKDLPDMIFTANAGQVIDGKALVAKFKYPERQGETAYFERWFKDNGYQPVKVTDAVWEGEGDCLVSGDTIFAGYGFRSDAAAQSELAAFFDRKVIGLKLVDPRFYHLDTCFCPLDDETIMYFPAAFDADSQQKIKASGRKLIEVAESDAEGFGINAVSDGHNVVLSSHVKQLLIDLKNAGFNPIPADVSEFKKSGGGVKCITLELRP